MQVKTVFMMGSYVSVKYNKRTRTISIEANENGFKSLAKIFEQFSKPQVSCDDTEVFLDPNCKEIYGDLDSSSNAVVIIKVPNTLS